MTPLQEKDPTGSWEIYLSVGKMAGAVATGDEVIGPPNTAH